MSTATESPLPAFSCFVPGIPQTQGGTVPFFKGGKCVQVTKGSKHLGSWRSAMSRAFALYARQQGLKAPLEGALRIGLVFVLERPKSHLRANGSVRESAPKRPHLCGTGDGDKFERACWDSCRKAEVIQDDSQFCRWEGVKRYALDAETPGVLVRIFVMQDSELEEVG